jgi:hypothetical protein
MEQRDVCAGKPGCELTTEDWEDDGWYCVSYGVNDGAVFHDLDCLIWWATNKQENPDE